MLPVHLSRRADVGATTINSEMGWPRARHRRARQAETSEQVALAYGIESISFGPEYIIPKPFDPRLIAGCASRRPWRKRRWTPASPRARRRPRRLRQSLSRFVYHSGVLMQPRSPRRRRRRGASSTPRARTSACCARRRSWWTKVWRGRPWSGARRSSSSASSARPARAPGQGVRPGEPESDPRYRDYWMTYHQLSERKGVTPEYARVEMRRHSTLIGAMMMFKGEADGMLCGTFGMHAEHLRYIDLVIGLRAGARYYAAMNAPCCPSAMSSSATPMSPRTGRRAHRRDHARRGRGGEALRHHAEGGAARHRASARRSCVRARCRARSS